MNFDQKIDREAGCGASSSKWQNFAPRFPGLNTEGALPMWVADMDFMAPEEVIVAMERRLKHGIFGYVCPDEVLIFAGACADWLYRRHGLKADAAQMLFTPGVLCGLNAAIQEFTEPGDGVIIQSPVYYPFANGIADNGRVIRRNVLIDSGGRYEIDFENLSRLAREPRTRLMVISSPHNPGGRVWSREELRRMADICLENGVLIFSDEIHSDLILYGNHHTPFHALGQPYAEHVIAAYAPSKTFNLAGLCASLMLIPNDELRGRFQKRCVANRLPRANIFGMVAGETAYEYGEPYLCELLAYLEGNIDYFTKAISENGNGIKIMKPQGTYLLWVDFNGTGLSEGEIYSAVVEKAGIAVDLGKWFGAGGEGFCRFNLACPRSTVEEAVDRLLHVF